MTFNPEQKAILISANEDYLTLADAALEVIPYSPTDAHQDAARLAIRHLIDRDYLFLSELEETTTERREVRRLDKEASKAILVDPKNWTHFNVRGTPYYALSPTDRGRQAFRKLLSVSD